MITPLQMSASLDLTEVKHFFLFYPQYFLLIYFGYVNHQPRPEWTLCVLMVTHWTECALSHSFLNQSSQPSSPEEMPYGVSTSLLSLCYTVLFNFSPPCLISPFPVPSPSRLYLLSPPGFSILMPLSRLCSFLFPSTCLNTQMYTHTLPSLPSCHQSFQGQICFMSESAASGHDISPSISLPPLPAPMSASDSCFSFFLSAPLNLPSQSSKCS